MVMDWPGRELIDIEAENHLRVRRDVDLNAGLVGRVVGEKEKKAAVERLGAAFFGEGDGEGLCRTAEGAARERKSVRPRARRVRMMEIYKVTG